MRHKSQKCAEALVPDRVDPCYIVGAYVANATALTGVKGSPFCPSAQVKSDMFF